jgi:hypothetical protein
LRDHLPSRAFSLPANRWEESNALMQPALDDISGQLTPTALRFVREAHQLDVECGSLREAQAL